MITEFRNFKRFLLPKKMQLEHLNIMQMLLLEQELQKAPSVMLL